MRARPKQLEGQLPALTIGKLVQLGADRQALEAAFGGGGKLSLGDWKAVEAKTAAVRNDPALSRQLYEESEKATIKDRRYRTCIPLHCTVALPHAARVLCLHTITITTSPSGHARPCHDRSDFTHGASPPSSG
eukprot:SAG22_NODE_2210_length_2832_cov_16.291621_2_plen_133_part_00